MRRLPRLLAAGAAILAIALAAPRAQVRPIYSLGTAGLTQILQRLQTTASVLHTGAHPDDEDSFFIARTARGDHARVGYMSLNRGEGGQNIIGSEQFEALGVIRTEELLQARRLDGGEQFFGRTFDYGFSKSRAEAASKWDERQVLGDMVRVIRMFRPLVIYSRFSGTPSDGHGHHQYAGYITPLAFRAAGDPTQFPDQIAEGLRPWQAKKFYRGSFNAAPGTVGVRVETGLFDPVLGRSYGEIASEGRNQHKTQQQGNIEARGPFESVLQLADTMLPSMTQEGGIFEGLDTTIPGIASIAGLPPNTLNREFEAVAAAAARALGQFDALHPEKTIPSLAEGLRATRATRQALSRTTAPDAARADADFLLALKEGEFVDALGMAAQVVVDPLADRETVAPGGSLTITVRAFIPTDSPAKVVSSVVRAPAGWMVAASNNAPTAGGVGRRESPPYAVAYTVTVAANAPPTQPYFLDTPRNGGDSYPPIERSPKVLPFNPPLLTADVTMDIGGERVVLSQPVTYRVADGVRGELRRDVNVTPAVTVALNSDLMVVPLGTAVSDQQVVVQATNFARQPVTGVMRLKLPAGWTSTPTETPFTLKALGEQTSSPFVVHVPPSRKAGAYDVVAEASVGGVTYSRGLELIAYPHIQTHRLYWPAKATAQVLDLKVAPVKVGYVMGSGDQVPDALRLMGVDVRLIDPDMLATGDLSVFDTIVVGIRASDARPDFVANNGRLLQYVERGGTLIVQYQQPGYLTLGMSPFPAQMASRVTDEHSAVRVLQPANPLFNFPNRITAADFDGWVQDRNLNAFTTFDPKYVPLLETADPDEPPQRGGELYAEIGKGRYVYTAYAWFRQLPAGVPGAYRQFANLVSLSKAPR